MCCRSVDVFHPAIGVLALVLLLGCPSQGSDAGGPPPVGDDDDDSAVDDDDDSAVDDDDDSAVDDDDAGDDDSAAGSDQELEVRALWVTRWDYGSEADVETIFQRAEDGGFNLVFFQVRGTADAYYESTYEPWAKRLTGTLGLDPGWDPLQSALDQGSARGIQVHAWLNTFPAWSGSDAPTESTPRHPLLDHPDWLVADASGTPQELTDGYVFFSPGNADVREHIALVVGDLVDRYEVDGVHLDYVRYPGAEYSHDVASEAAFASSSAISWADWQRAQVLSTVQGVQAAVETARPGTLLTAAVWGIYEDLWGWNSSEGNNDYYQDSLAMVADGLLDAIVPMIYWPMTEPMGGYTDFATLVDAFAAVVPREALWVGMSADYDDFGEIDSEILWSRSAGAGGVALFAYATLVARDYFDELGAGPFQQPGPGL